MCLLIFSPKLDEPERMPTNKVCEARCQTDRGRERERERGGGHPSSI